MDEKTLYLFDGKISDVIDQLEGLHDLFKGAVADGVQISGPGMCGLSGILRKNIDTIQDARELLDKSSR